MGGYAGGDVAARLALAALTDGSVPSPAGEAEVRSAFERAHRRIREASASHPEWSEMGTTLTAVWIRRGRAFIGHVGDSRAYLVRGEHIEQITQDHSVTAELVRNGTLTEEEARTHPHRHVLTRALGGDGPVEVDVMSLALRPGDRLVLCTDGLTGSLESDEIGRVVRASATPRAAAEALVQRACEHRSTDNVTVVIAFIEEDDLDQEDPPGVDPT